MGTATAVALAARVDKRWVRSRWDKGRITKALQFLGIPPGATVSEARQAFKRLWVDELAGIRHIATSSRRARQRAIVNAFLVAKASILKKPLPGPIFPWRRGGRRLGKAPPPVEILAGAPGAVWNNGDRRRSQ